MVPTDQLATFEQTLRAGHYSLLFGAGVSTDSSNVLGQNIQGAEQFRKVLCSRYSLDAHTPLHEAAELLVLASDRDKLLIKPFTCHTPGRTLEYLYRFCWRRIYTLNFDDVLEKLHEQSLDSEIKPKQQKLTPFHFNDPSVPEHSDDELQAVHLHGTVRKPDAPIVLTWSQYGEITRSLNGWMTQLSDFLRSSPFIIAGTRFSEPDLDHYLIGRTKQNPSGTWGPSLWIESNPTPVTRARCDRHGLLLVEANFRSFLEWLAKTFSDISAPWEQYALDIRELIVGTPLAQNVARFGSSFRLVRSYRAGSGQKTRRVSKFFFGQEPTWEDIRDKLDIGRKTTDVNLPIIKSFVESNQTGKQVFLITGYAGAGKTTILKRLAYLLASEQFIVLYVKPGKRIDVTATLDCLSNIASSPIVVADSMFECAREITEIFERSTVGITVIGAERDYRCGILRQILRGWHLREIPMESTTREEAAELLLSYKKQGLLAYGGNENALVASIVRDEEPIAVTVCRLLNDYRPLNSIVDSLWTDSEEVSRVLYLCCTIAVHCVSEGLRREIAATIANSLGTRVEELIAADAHPLRLSVSFQDAVRDEFVRTGNPAISERLLDRRRHYRDVENLYSAFVVLANSISSYVTKEAIRRRTPEARLAARLFDVDYILHECLGDKVDRFFKDVQSQWEWHSQYWAQRALANKNKDIRLAIQYARNSVRIQPDHPSTLNTLGTLLLEFGKQSAWQAEDSDRVFEEALTVQERAVKSAIEIRWDSEYPWVTLFNGAMHFLNSGKLLKPINRQRLETLIGDTKSYRWRFSSAIGDSLAALERKLSGS